MTEEFDAFSPRVTQGDDGIYRWYYDLDMMENRSMLHILLRANLFIFLLALVLGGLLMALTRTDAHYIRGIAVVWVLLLAGMSVMYVIGYAIAAKVKGVCRIHFEMKEDEMELVWPDRLKKGMDVGAKALSLAGVAMGSRVVRGRYRPTLNEVSHAPFQTVTRVKIHPRWNMLDLYMPGGKFQVYALEQDFDFVKSFILERLSDAARRRSKQQEAP